MKILVANPPAYIGNRNRHFIQAGSRWSHSLFISKNHSPKDHCLPYPFFIGYSSALLKRNTGHEIKAIDACAKDFDEHGFIDYVNKHNPDLLLVEVPTVSFPLVMDVLGKIKASNPNLKIALAGDHVTALTEEIMTSYLFIDYCLVGEYEISLKALLDALERESDLENLRGIAFREGDRVVINERRELLRDLDFLPFPDRDDLHIEDYHDIEICGEPCVQMRTARGCPFHCAFCAPRQVIYACSLYRKRKSEKVVDEMETCQEKFHAKQVYFDDETMIRNHVRQICEEIIGRKIDIPWACMGDVNLDLDTLQLMRKAGCVGVKFGIETIDLETLSHIGKGFVRVEKIEQFREQCKKLGLWTHATYMVGLPSDTEEKVRATRKFAIKLDTESAQFAMATPFPGTPFFVEAREKGWLTTLKWTKYDGANFSVLSYPWFSKEKIEELYHWMCDSWKKHTGKRYLTHPIQTLKRVRVIGLKRAVKAIWSLKGAFV